MQRDTRSLLPARTAEAHNPPRKLGEYVMPGPYKEAARRLHEIAQSQQGFFTTKQATRSGFAEKTHSYHVNAGNWIRGSASECSPLNAAGSPRTTELTSSGCRTELTKPGCKCNTVTLCGSRVRLTMCACGGSFCASPPQVRKQSAVRCTKLVRIFIA